MLLTLYQVQGVYGLKNKDNFWGNAEENCPGMDGAHVSMKINTLAGISCVNAETIRKYRNRNLLRPECDPENGYYRYTQADFLNLLYIRKLRGANLSLDSIESTY